MPVTAQAVYRHLEVLQEIADRNGKRRTSGTPGHEESVDYVVGKLHDAGFDVTVQKFDFPYSETVAEHLTVDGDSVDVTVMRHSPNSPIGGITAELAVLPYENALACEPGDFDGRDYTGKIVLLRRGVVPFSRKQQNAAAAGAVGAVIYNSDDQWHLGSLGSDAAGRIPTGGVSKSDGEALSLRDGAQVRLELRTWSEQRVTRNVIAQTKTGRKDSVVMAGAHLDSVVEGPGINDAGSGCAALLEIAVQLGGSPQIDNALRFVWWGAEEFGQLGSKHYVATLTPEQQQDIALYLTADMLASSNGGYFVFDGTGPDGSAAIRQSFVDALAARGEQTEDIPLAGGFDHMPFVQLGIPAGGLYSGATGIKTTEQAEKWGGTAGVAFDPGYHRNPDDLANIDRVALANNTAALVAVTEKYARTPRRRS